MYQEREEDILILKADEINRQCPAMQKSLNEYFALMKSRGWEGMEVKKVTMLPRGRVEMIFDWFIKKN